MQEAARRNALRRMEDRAALRLEVRARDRMRKLVENATKLENAKDLSSKEIAGLKAANETHWRLLTLVLPPLKAVERDESPESELKRVTEMSTQELLALARSQMPPLEAEVVEVKEPAKQKEATHRDRFEHWPFG